MNKIKFVFLLIVISFSSALAQFDDNKSNMNQYLSMSSINVTIGGNFIITGSYPALATERLDQFITRLYNDAKSRAIANASNSYEKEQILNKFDEISFRDVTLKRVNGDELKLDILKFRKTGDYSQNPYLKNDDVIIFPPTDLERNFFSIGGAVNNPGKFNFVEGDRLSDAIELANGINKAYENVDKVEINRLSYSGEQLNSIKININDDFALQRGDRIIVLADETQRKEFSVTVVGEVNLPGEIPITKNTTTLKQVLERAGGVTEKASLKRAKVFTGNSIRLLIQRLYGIKLKDTQEVLDTIITERLLNLEELMMDRMSSLTPEEKQYFRIDNELRVLNDGSSVNLLNYEDENSEAASYIVKQGNIIVIPPKINTVNVFGQVANPGRINYEEGKGIDYYIKKAGGLGEFAIEDEIMVIKGESREWISPEDKPVKIEEGDFIWVPREIIRGFNYYIGQIGTYLGIVGSAATVILLLIQFNKK